MNKNEIKDEDYFELADFFSAFSDSTRLKILINLLEGEKTVTEICNLTGISQSAISHQLTKLRIMKLVKGTKSGKYTHYTLDDQHIETIINYALEHRMEP
ncbi:MAG: metalloregulator ArsR/SmtB family transcription factor [Spirochaetia bacterium]|jgi:DNA-binding transcriptional ArsR family regulator|nr:metalloregulator ArsR/SmtB family transcription factor [Spirochaetia bacterium]